MDDFFEQEIQKRRTEYQTKADKTEEVVEHNYYDGYVAALNWVLDLRVIVKPAPPPGTREEP